MKSETNINHEEWAVIHYIFRVMYEKIFLLTRAFIVFNGSKCLIS
jgi:hypothetical protein